MSGFTQLSEAMESSGKGAEGLASHLNSYFGIMCRLISADGGDVFKFAGDACIVLWPNTDSVKVRILRAVQCAYAIQSELHEANMDEGVQLSVKCGIGVGKVSVLHIGGVLNRMEYLAVGEPLLQAFQVRRGVVTLLPQLSSSTSTYDVILTLLLLFFSFRSLVLLFLHYRPNIIRSLGKL